MQADHLLPPLENDDFLGRGVFRPKEAKRWEQGKRVRDTFLEAEHRESLSVDRLDMASDECMTIIADAAAAGRGPDRKFYGWAVLTVADASANGRMVRASPLPRNSYHADIDLNIRADLERRDAQKQHADDLAARAHWRPRVHPA